MFNIPQLALAKLTQTGNHQTGMVEVTRSILAGSSFFMIYCYSISTLSFNVNIVNYVLIERNLYCTLCLQWRKIEKKKYNLDKEQPVECYI